MICPDCDAEVVEANRRSGRCYVELVDDGPWALVQFGADRLPLATIAKRWPPAAKVRERYALHRCSRRARVDDDLTTIARAYEHRQRGPRLNIPASRLADDVKQGDALTLYDNFGHEVRADVLRVEFVAVPRLDTLRELDRVAA